MASVCVYCSVLSGIVNIVTKEGEQKYSGNLITYFGDYVTSEGYTFDGQYVPTYNPAGADAAHPYSRDGIYYGLNEVLPFDNYNVEGSLSGPIPVTSGMTFYLSGRYFKSNGWLYGNRVFNTDGTLVGQEYYTLDDVVIDQNGFVSGVRLRDNVTAMNGRTRLSGQAKLTIPISGAIKLNLSGIGSKIDYRDYSHDWFLLLPG